MTIQDLGSIGELLAAIATIATLIYLALQIRGSAAATRAEARRSMDLDSHEAIRRIAGDRELAQLFMLGLGKPDALNPEQAFRFRLCLSPFFSTIDTAWKEVRLRTMSEEELSDIFHFRLQFFQTRGGKAWWQENSGIFSEEFRKYFESQLPGMKPTDSTSSSRPDV